MSVKVLVTFFHVIQSVFESTEWFLSFTQKCMEKWQKSSFTRKAIISKPMKIFASKFEGIIFKPIKKNVISFKISIF